MKSALNPKKERITAPNKGPRTPNKAATIFAAPIWLPLFFLLLNLQNSVWYENQNNELCIPNESARVQRGHENFSKENNIRKKIIRKGTLNKIECLSPIFAEIFAAGNRTTMLSTATSAKNEKIADREWPI